MMDSTSLAITYPQLMNQGVAAGFSVEDLESLKAAFQFSHDFSDGFYRAEQTPLICHLTRTASILMVQKCELNVITAGLLHACMLIHKFDNNCRTSDLGIRKRELHQIFNKEVVRLVSDYANLEWFSSKNIDNHLVNIRGYERHKINLITIQLANEVDDHLDGAVHYTSQNRVNHRADSEYLEKCIALSEALNLDYISQELNRINQFSGNIPVALKTLHRQGYEAPIERKWSYSRPYLFLRKIKRLASSKSVSQE